MAIKQVTAWETERGTLHKTPEDAAETEFRRKAYTALSHLLNDGGSTIIRFASSGECALWMIEHRHKVLEILK